MIKSFYVHNFRCLENFEMKISDKPSVLLFGKNGAGKSTVSFALEVLKTIASGTTQIREIVKPSDFSRGRSDVPMRFTIKAEIESVDYEYELALELPSNFKELSILEEKLTANNSEVFSREKAQVRLTKSERNSQSQFFVDWHLVALPIIQEISEKDPIHIFKKWLARMLILAPIPSLITGQSKSETLSPNRQVSNFSDWFSGLLASEPSIYPVIDEYLRDIMPDFRAIKNPVIGLDARSMVVEFKQEQANLSLPFQDLSDGEKCFFICAVVLAANKVYNSLFCFWDEPDNYLSPDEVSHFVTSLRRSFQIAGQLIITSHNITAIRQFSDENTLQLHRNSHFEPTVIRLLSEMSVDGDLGDALIRGDIGL